MKYLFSLIVALLLPLHSFACTSVIISSKHSASGKPLMLKHRDSGELDNRVEYYSGDKYSFIGLVNSFHEEDGVWTGVNSRGFSIMNTASYNIKDDDMEQSLMDKEGILMFRALGECADLNDFEKLLDTLERPLGVEANFGVIDANGGAAYYEVNNYSWVKYDVNEIPCGYRVVTNFSESGRYEDYKGYERYLTATDIMHDIASSGKIEADHNLLFNSFSRSYRHSFTGMDYLSDYERLVSEFGFTGRVVDQDFIPRHSTACSIVIEGVAPGENPFNTVMWTLLGYPSASVYVPLMVMDSDMIPEFMKRRADSQTSLMCDLSLKLKESDIFKYKISNGTSYLDLSEVKEKLITIRNIEADMDAHWDELYDILKAGNISVITFKQRYRALMQSYFNEIGNKLFLNCL